MNEKMRVKEVGRSLVLFSLKNLHLVSSAYFFLDFCQNTFILKYCNHGLRGDYNSQMSSRGHKDRNQGQGQSFPGQTLLRPRTGMLEAKDTGVSVPPPKKNVVKFFFQAISKKKGQIFFQAISKRGKQEKFSQNFFEVSVVFQQNFNDSKNSVVLEPRTGQFSIFKALRPWT